MIQQNMLNWLLWVGAYQLLDIHMQDGDCAITKFYVIVSLC